MTPTHRESRSREVYVGAQLAFSVFLFEGLYEYICVCVCVGTHMCTCSWRPDEGIRSPETEVLGGCELPDIVAGKKNSVFLQEQQVLVNADSSLQLLFLLLFLLSPPPLPPFCFSFLVVHSWDGAVHSQVGSSLLI